MPSDARNSSRWYEVLAALTPLIVGVCVTGVGAFFTQVYNQRQLQLSQLAALDKFKSALVSENPVEREFAYASFAALGYEGLALKLIQVKRDSAGRAVAQEIQLSGNAAAQAEAKTTLSALPVQVFFHIGAESLRDKAKDAAAALQQAGYASEGIENVAGKATSPKATEVRYFNDADKANADAIANTLRTLGFTAASARKISFLKARPGTLEVWFGADAEAR